MKILIWLFNLPNERKIKIKVKFKYALINISKQTSYNKIRNSLS